MVGNKADLDEARYILTENHILCRLTTAFHRQVSTAEAEAKAKEFGAAVFRETSAKSGSVNYHRPVVLNVPFYSISNGVKP